MTGLAQLDVVEINAEEGDRRSDEVHHGEAVVRYEAAQQERAEADAQIKQYEVDGPERARMAREGAAQGQIVAGGDQRPVACAEEEARNEEHPVCRGQGQGDHGNDDQQQCRINGHVTAAPFQQVACQRPAEEGREGEAVEEVHAARCGESACHGVFAEEGNDYGVAHAAEEREDRDIERPADEEIVHLHRLLFIIQRPADDGAPRELYEEGQQQRHQRHGRSGQRARIKHALIDDAERKERTCCRSGCHTEGVIFRDAVHLLHGGQGRRGRAHRRGGCTEGHAVNEACRHEEVQIADGQIGQGQEEEEPGAHKKHGPPVHLVQEPVHRSPRGKSARHEKPRRESRHADGRIPFGQRITHGPEHHHEVDHINQKIDACIAYVCPFPEFLHVSSCKNFQIRTICHVAPSARFH